MNLNKAFLIGNLTSDPDLRTLPSGTPVSSFGLATNRIWNSPQGGGRQQEVEFHNVVAFGRNAEIVSQYLKKGSLVFVEGRIRTNSWEGKDGTRRNRTEIITERIQLGPRGAGFSGASDKSFSKDSGSGAKQEAHSGEEMPSINIEESTKEENLPF